MGGKPELRVGTKDAAELAGSWRIVEWGANGISHCWTEWGWALQADMGIDA